MAEKINIGSLNKIISIEKQTLSKEMSGQTVAVWTAFVENIFAALNYHSGNERFEADEKISEYKVNFIIRDIPGINETMRIVYKSKNYYIESILPYGNQDRYLKIICTKKDNE